MHIQLPHRPWLKGTVYDKVEVKCPMCGKAMCPRHQDEEGRFYWFHACVRNAPRRWYLMPEGKLTLAHWLTDEEWEGLKR